MTAPDGALKPALTRLADAISALCDPKPILVQRRTHWLPSLYRQLADTVAGQTGDRGATRVTIPVRIDCLDMLMEIDTAAHCWQPVGDDTPDRLWRLHNRPWRPQDTSSLDELADNIASWVKSVDALLYPQQVFELRINHAYAACPECHTTSVKVRRNGEWVNQAALTASADHGGFICHQCHHTWPIAAWGILAARISSGE